jgi:hypothetical protein
MTIESDDMMKLLPGAKAIVSACEATTHGNNAGCLCRMKGEEVTIGALYETPFVGTPTWWITSDKRARLSELTLVVKK